MYQQLVEEESVAGPEDRTNDPSVGTLLDDRLAGAMSSGPLEFRWEGSRRCDQRRDELGHVFGHNATGRARR